MKFSAFIAAILLTVGLISCGDKKEDGNMTGDSAKTEAPAQPEAPATPPPAAPSTGDSTMDSTHK